MSSIERRSFGTTVQSKSLHRYLKEILGSCGALSYLGVKTVERFEKWKFPTKPKPEVLDLILPQVVIAFGGWKPKETILNDVAVQGHNEFHVHLLTRSDTDTPSGPDSTEMIEIIAEEFIQEDSLRPPPGLWKPDPNAETCSIFYKQFKTGMALHHCFTPEIFPISPMPLDALNVDQQTFTLAMVGDSYKR